MIWFYDTPKHAEGPPICVVPWLGIFRDQKRFVCSKQRDDASIYEPWIQFYDTPRSAEGPLIYVVLRRGTFRDH